MHVSGDQHGWKTCLQVYNPAGISMEFTIVRSGPQRLDCVLSIVVWRRVPPHHQIEQNPNPKRLGFLFLAVPERARMLVRRPTIATRPSGWRLQGIHRHGPISTVFPGHFISRGWLPRCPRPSATNAGATGALPRTGSGASCSWSTRANEAGSRTRRSSRHAAER